MMDQNRQAAGLAHPVLYLGWRWRAPGQALGRIEALELLMQHLRILARQDGNVEHAKPLEQLAEPNTDPIDPRQIGTLDNGEEKLRRNLGGSRQGFALFQFPSRRKQLAACGDAECLQAALHQRWHTMKLGDW